MTSCNEMSSVKVYLPSAISFIEQGALQTFLLKNASTMRRLQVLVAY